MIYHKTRNKTLVNSLASEGWCITYKRVKSIQLGINNKLCSIYHEKGLASSPNLRTGIFTTSAIDNIDHNTSSNTSTSSFHGTSITIFQHPETNVAKHSFRFDLQNTSSMSERATLPTSFTDDLPFRGGKPEPLSKPPQDRINCLSIADVAQDAHDWIQCLQQPAESIEKRPFVGFYTSNKLVSKVETVNKHLPILIESVNSLAIVRHCTKIITEITEQLNPECRVQLLLQINLFMP